MDSDKLLSARVKKNAQQNAFGRPLGSMIRSLTVESNVRPASTLRIPTRLLRRFRRKQKKHGGTAAYLQHLLELYQASPGRLPVNLSVTRGYQPPGQDVTRLHFRPSALDWVRLRNLAQHLGWSMCHLFVLMLLDEVRRPGARRGVRIRRVRDCTTRFTESVLVRFGLVRRRFEVSQRVRASPG